MAKYNKGIVVVLGLLVLLGRQYFGLELETKSIDQAINLLVGLLTAAGVIGVRNAS